MKALSTKQPWAWLILHAEMDIENRNWKTHYRGRLAIHASKTFDRDGYEWLIGPHPEMTLIPKPGEYQLGGIVGLVELVDCVTVHNSKWFSGPYGFVLTNPEIVDFIPYKGSQGIFNIDI